MFEYSTATALQFVGFAVIFTTIFGIVAWRVVKTWERESKTEEQNVEPPEDKPDSESDVAQ